MTGEVLPFTKNYMQPYWEQVVENTERQLSYAQEQLARIAFKDQLEFDYEGEVND